MYGERYVWIIDDYTSAGWWKNVTWLGCTDEEMYTVVKNYIGVVLLGFRKDGNRAVSGLVRYYHQPLPSTIEQGPEGVTTTCNS